MSEQLQGVLWSGVGLVLVAFVGIIGNYLVKRLRSRASEPEMWKRLDELSFEVYGGKDVDGAEQPGLRRRVESSERQLRAVTSVVRDLARQWSGPTPRLNPFDIAELPENTIPTHWKVKP